MKISSPVRKGETYVKMRSHFTGEDEEEEKEKEDKHNQSHYHQALQRMETIKKNRETLGKFASSSAISNFVYMLYAFINVLHRPY